MTPWLRLDERENAIDNLEMVGRLLGSIHSEHRWKWGILALHQALYGFAISAVQRSDPLSVLRDPEDHESHLISIHQALRRCRTGHPGMLTLTTSPEEERALDLLIRHFRNGFEHFRPAAWSIETTGMPDIFRHVLRVVRYIALDSGGVRYYEEDQEPRVRSALSDVERELG